MPVTRPALVKDFGKELWIKVVGLLPDNVQHVLLPGFKGRIGAQEPQQIVLRMGWNTLSYHFIGHTRAGSVKQVVVGLGNALLFHHLTLGVGLAYDTLVRVDMAVERKTDVHQVLDS